MDPYEAYRQMHQAMETGDHETANEHAHNLPISNKERKMYMVSVTCNCGVRGKAKQYSYHCAKLYQEQSGRWVATSISGPPRRGYLVLADDCRRLAAQYGCDTFTTQKISASLHNVRLSRVPCSKS